MLQHTPVKIYELSKEDIKIPQDISEANGSMKPSNYWSRCAEGLEKKELTIIVASLKDQHIAYAILNWSPKYRVYDQLGIPEIQDLNVLRDFRRQGIGAEIIAYCENQAKEKEKTQIGISYGLTKDYGPAQRLYTRLGYVPDGFGVTYDREPVNHGQLRTIDDDLCLMLLKDLN